MAFNHVQPKSGPFYLGPYASMAVAIYFGKIGDDHGAIWIMANPIKGQPPTTLQVSDFTKMLDYSVKSVSINGDPVMGFDPKSAYYWYGCTVTNLGPDGVFFNLDGGGNS
jgi:hypothetical protein